MKCIYCGIRNSSKKGDHLPPQSIYPKPRRENIELFTVPACQRCNSSFSRDDEEFKVMISFATGEIRPNSEDVINSTSKTLEFNKKLGNSIFSNSRDVYHTLRGDILRPAKAISMDKAPLFRVMTRIVKGYFWKEFNKRLSSSAEILILPEQEVRLKQHLFLKKVFKDQQCSEVNGGDFKYSFAQVDNAGMIWEFNFFDDYKVYAVVNGIDTTPFNST